MVTGVGVLAAFDVLERPAIALDDEWVPVRVLLKRHADRSVVVVARERRGDRLFRINVEWTGGWLDPVVDEADVADANATFEPSSRLRAVSAAGWTGRFPDAAPAPPTGADDLASRRSQYR